VSDVVVGLQQLAVAAGFGFGPTEHTDLQNTSLQSLEVASTPPDQPAASEVLDFARSVAAAAVQGATVREVEAIHPSAEGHWTDWIARQTKDLATSLKFPDSPTDATGVTPQADAHDIPDSVKESISEMHRAYTFAIKASLASRGSTEVTKIFNTLLKGG
jgi:hypothetical protein